MGNDRTFTVHLSLIEQLINNKGVLTLPDTYIYIYIYQYVYTHIQLSKRSSTAKNYMSSETHTAAYCRSFQS
jgi:hypothetical protein